MSVLKPEIEKLKPATRKLYDQLCAYPEREEADENYMTLLGRDDLANDIRAYLTALAHHDVERYRVDVEPADWMLEKPRVMKCDMFRLPRGRGTHGIFIGEMGSGHPIVACLSTEDADEALIVNWDDEGYAYTYDGIEGYLTDYRWR